jgi:tetratricopeptide (TPR) repeat protein
MRRLVKVVVVVGVFVGVGAGGNAHAERRKNGVVEGTSLPSCMVAADRVTATLAVDAKTRSVLAQRCTSDRWSRDTTLCFAQVSSPTEAALCLDTLSKVQRKAIEGDADRLADVRLSRWLMRRTLVSSPTAPALVTLASYDASQDNVGNARTLHTRGMSAYQAGRYDVASKSFSAAMSASPTADNVYLAAQSYRMKGERAKALELYERYLEIAPSGPAAPACRYQIERLRDSNP